MEVGECRGKSISRMQLLKESDLLNHYNPKKPLIVAVMPPPMV